MASRRSAGKRVGLVTNHTGRARDGATDIDLLHAQGRDARRAVQSRARHPRRARRQRAVEKDEKTGLPIHSLYGETRRPTAAMLDGLDTIVIDLQDIGARFYTYMTTMAYVMEEAAKRKIAGGRARSAEPDQRRFRSKGPTLDKSMVGFTGYFRRCRSATG